MHAGQEIMITVAGRPSARLVAVGPRRWRTWDEISDLFDGGPPDRTRGADRDLVARGRTSRALDLLIAATAHAHAARLHTRNAGDLVGLDELIEVVPV